MSLSREHEVLHAAIREAGEAVLRIAASGFETHDKGHQDPVTTADLEANRILERRLLEEFPDHGWFSEETHDDRSRLERDRVWIVDPVDGTREFVKGIPEYCVSVALVEAEQPILGAIFNPASGELFSAEHGKGVLLNGVSVRADHPVAARLCLVASRSETGRGQFDPIEPLAEVRVVGSIAYKHALVAAGEADAVISLSPKNEWDIVAGVLMVREGGGEVTDLAGDPLAFNQPETRVNGVIAASGAAYPRAVELAARARST